MSTPNPLTQFELASQVDSSAIDNLHERWESSDSNLSFIDWLHAIILHQCDGKGSYQEREHLKMLVNVLVKILKS